MKLFFRYIASKRAAVLAWMVFCILFAVSFLAYRLPVSAVIYPAALSGAIGFAFILFGFFKAKKRYIVLKRTTGENMTWGDLPEMPRDIETDELVRIIDELYKKQERVLAEMQRKNSEMREYYTVWAHQIKTPISVMKLRLQSEDSPLSRSMQSELSRIEGYVEMVMVYLRLGSNDHDYVFKECDLDSLIKHSVSRFSSEFIDRGIGLEYGGVDFELVTDKKWFCFVLEQILSNSLKYTPSDGVIRIFMKDRGTLCIADTGIGIAYEDQPRVFDMSYTGLNGRENRASSGIGLYLCKRICDRLGIGIGLNSEPNRGTTVCLELSQYELRPE